MLNFKQFFQEGLGAEFDQLGIERNQMASVLNGTPFMIGDELSGQLKINGRVYSAPLPARIDIHDNLQLDEKGNFISGTLVITPGYLPTQTGKVGRKMDKKMYQNPTPVEEIKVHVNAKQLHGLLNTGLQQASSPQAAMGAMSGMGAPPSMGGPGGL